MSIEKYKLGKCTIEIERDELCDNPLDDDGEGKIYSFNTRHSNFAHPDNIQSVLEKGDEDWLVPLSYYEHGGCLWDVEGGELISQCPDMSWDGRVKAGVYVPDSIAKENIELRVYLAMHPHIKVEYRSKHNPDGTCITRKAKPGESAYFKDGTRPDERYSNVITWEITEGAHAGKSKGGYKSFISAFRQAVRVSGVVTDLATYEALKVKKLREYAAHACKQYTSYLNGECYWYMVTHENGEEASCGGFLGDIEYCEKEAEEAAKHLNAQAEKIEQETQLAECYP